MFCPACGTENIDGSDRCENCLTPFRDLDVPRPDGAEGLARSVMEDKLNELGYDDPICATPDTPALEVVRRMQENHSGCALVVQGGKLLGIFTEHDVLLKMTSGMEQTKSDPPGAKDCSADVLVSELMTANPETLHENETVAFALNKMSMGRYRHLPVFKCDGTYTVASIRNVLNYIAKEEW